MPRKPREPPTEPEPRRIDPQKRVNLPNEVMEALGVKPGDYVAFHVVEGRVSVHKVRWVVEKE